MAIIGDNLFPTLGSYGTVETSPYTVDFGGILDNIKASNILQLKKVTVSIDPLATKALASLKERVLNNELNDGSTGESEGENGNGGASGGNGGS